MLHNEASIQRRIPWKLRQLVYECTDLIALDIVSCRYCYERVRGTCKIPNLATISLRGCEMCGSCPEGPAFAGSSPISHLPLLSPIPLYSSTIRPAQLPPESSSGVPPFLARCSVCIIKLLYLPLGSAVVPFHKIPTERLICDVLTCR